MILSEIADFLQERHQASLADIARHFNAEPSAVRGMLEVWIAKGKVKKLKTFSACTNSCSQCSPDSIEWYAWTLR